MRLKDNIERLLVRYQYGWFTFKKWLSLHTKLSTKQKPFFSFCLHTQLSVQIKSLFKLAIWASCGQNVRSSAFNIFYRQSSPLSIQVNSFSSIGTIIWNEMLVTLRNLSKNAFKRKIKLTHFWDPSFRRLLYWSPRNHSKS